MPTPASLPPPPLDSVLAQDDGKPAPTWAKWLQLLWARLKQHLESLEDSIGDVEDAAVQLSDASPNAIGTTNPGTDGESSRSDHVHAHGNQAGGSLHSVATGASAGFMSAADKTKLDGVATGAAALTSSAPADVSTSAAVGVGTTAARSDHVHAHANLAGGSLHALAIAAGAAGFLSGTDKTKLDNTSGVNSGDVTRSAFSTSGDAFGWTLTGQAIAHTAATATHPGGVSLSSQVLGAGTKTVNKLVVNDTSGDTVKVNVSDFIVQSSTHNAGVGTTSVGSGYAIAGDVAFEAKRDGPSFVLVSTENVGSTSDAGIGFTTVTSHEDAGIFLDHSDSRKLKVAMGDLDSDANRNTNTKLWLTQAGNFGIGISPTRPLQVQGTATISSFTGLGHTAAPQYQVDLGSTLADTKIAFYNDMPGGGSSIAGIGIQSADIRFHGDGFGGKFSWHNGPSTADLMTFTTGTGILNVTTANGITIGGVVVPTLSSTSTLTNKTLTSPTINAATLSGTLAGNCTISGNNTHSGANTYSGLSTFTSGIKRSFRATTATTVTMATTDHVIAASANSGNVTVNLQAAATAGAGRPLVVKKTDASANTVTLDGSGSETIDGATTYVLAAQYKWVEILCDGTNWLVTGAG